LTQRLNLNVKNTRDQLNHFLVIILNALSLQKNNAFDFVIFKTNNTFAQRKANPEIALNI